MKQKIKHPHPKQPDLDPPEIAALRDIANQRKAQSHILVRLAEIGLVEETAGTWTPTHQGKIQLMFASAR
jgi:hypothetical protein